LNLTAPWSSDVLVEACVPPPPLVTVTAALPWTAPAVAVTVYGPPAVAPAVKSPEAPTVPPPVVAQAKVGCGRIAAPNWSRALAASCRLASTATLALAGETATLVAVWLTATPTLLVTDWPSASVIVAWSW
jgi:hypothetical protein